VFVATYFLRNLKDINWDDVSDYAPAVLAAVMMPLTYSIAYGVAIGFIAYVVIKALSGKTEDLNAGSVSIALLSVLYFIAT
jgi:AGZA family xanthine/uracil permease-like MFS transporter